MKHLLKKRESIIQLGTRFVVTILLICLVGCGEKKVTLNQSELTVNGIKLYLPNGGQGEHIYTGGEPPIYKWVNDIGTLKIEEKEVFWNDKQVGTVGDNQHIVVSGEGEVSIVDK